MALGVYFVQEEQGIDYSIISEHFSTNITLDIYFLNISEFTNISF